MDFRRWLACTATPLILWLGAAPAGAVSITITTSVGPADGWRAIAPVGDLAGQPISTVGLAWEAADVGWNTSLTFDDSDAAGWHVPVFRDVTRYGSTATNHIWADDPQGAGDTPGYFRKVFTLDADPVLALLGGAVGTTDSVIDDDAQIWVNGTLVFDDRDGVATTIGVEDVTAHLHEGQNLIAIKAHDTFGADEHFSLILRIDPAVPEPTTPLLLLVAAAAGCGLAQRRKWRAEDLEP